MDARRTLLAAVASAGLHVALALLLAWLCAARGGDDLAARLRALAEAQPPPTVELSDRVDVEVVVAPAEVAPAPLREGDGTRDPQHDGAPTHYAGRDRHPVAPAAGSGAGLPPVPEWTGRRDPDTLHTQLADSTAGYQMQRTHTGDRRVSPDPVPQLPHPDLASTLARRSGPGAGRIPGVAGGVGPGSDFAGLTGSSSGSALGDGTRVRKDGDEVVGRARPFVPAGPLATDAPERDEPRPSDDVTTRLRSYDPHPHALAGMEMTRASSPGAGSSSGGPARSPGFAPRPTTGSAALPLGDPGAPPAEELWLRTTDRRYVGYFQKVYQRVRSHWVFPRELALKLQQGLVVVSFTIRRDGRIDDIAVRKSSGFKEFDENVVLAVERAAPLPPVPASLGARDLHVNAPFEYLNPLVR